MPTFAFMKCTTNVQNVLCITVVLGSNCWFHAQITCTLSEWSHANLSLTLPPGCLSLGPTPSPGARNPPHFHLSSVPGIPAFMPSHSKRTTSHVLCLLDKEADVRPTGPVSCQSELEFQPHINVSSNQTGLWLPLPTLSPSHKTELRWRCRFRPRCWTWLTQQMNLPGYELFFWAAQSQPEICGFTGDGEFFWFLCQTDICLPACLSIYL